MFGFETFVIPTLATLISYSECERKPPPRITTQVDKKQISYDTSKTHQDLANFNIDTISPYGSGVHTYVSGLMSGNINVSMSAKVGWSTNRMRNISCLWYDEINIEVTSSPVIYIAKEHKNDRCRYNATMRHEMKHVKMDNRILATYVPKFRYEVESMVRQIGVVGPVRADDVTKAREDMNSQIQQIIQRVMDEMKLERRTRQQEVDSRVEYDRMSNMCR